MPNSFSQFGLDSSGNKVREQSLTIDSDLVSQQAVYQAARRSYLVMAENIALATSKQHLAIFNSVGSNKVVRIQKLFITIMDGTAISGGSRRFDVKKITACSAGTDIIPVKQDSDNGDLPVGLLFKTGATVTESSLLFPLVFTVDEQTLTSTAFAETLLAGLNWFPEGIELQEYTLNEGEGVTIKQITASAIGTLSWLCVISVEAD